MRVTVYQYGRWNEAKGNFDEVVGCLATLEKISDLKAEKMPGTMGIDVDDEIVIGGLYASPGLFYVQIYLRNENGKLSLTAPQATQASTHDDAAKCFCGKGVTPEIGQPSNLVAKVWRVDQDGKHRTKPYYRQQKN